MAMPSPSFPGLLKVPKLRERGKLELELTAPAEGAEGGVE
jgi:hypothetical protein